MCHDALTGCVLIDEHVVRTREGGEEGRGSEHAGGTDAIDDSRQPGREGRGGRRGGGG